MDTNGPHTTSPPNESFNNKIKTLLNEITDSDDDLFAKGVAKSAKAKIHKLIKAKKEAKNEAIEEPAIDEGFDYVDFPNQTPDQ